MVKHATWKNRGARSTLALACFGLTFALNCVAGRAQPAAVDGSPREEGPSAPAALLDPPQGDDYTAASLRAYQERIAAHYGGYTRIPLDVKAAYFDWELWRYHLTPYGQVYNRAVFPEQPGQPPLAFPARDSSTWNGALLGALSFRYAATRDAETLRRIATVVRGLHLFFEVTGQPGLMARAVAREDNLRLPELDQQYVSPDGTRYYYQGDPAKGGYNQIAGGYAALFMHALADLPQEVQQLAREDCTALVMHLIEHNWRATNPDGTPTTYGDLRPLFGSMSVPFNAQVAYMIVALGYSFPPDNEAQRERIAAEFRRLRGEHHVYFEYPLRSLVLPQRVGASPFVKGMNDRAHVTLAAFYGLALELDHARRHGQPPNEKFLYQLGRTMYWSMDYLHDKRNSLCAFMWGGLLSDPLARSAIVERAERHVWPQLERALREGVEQLARFPLDRFCRDGPDVIMPELQWCDDAKPCDNYWHWNPYSRQKRTGPPKNVAYCGMDYLYAYWLLRYYGLDQHPALAPYRLGVLARTPGLP